MEFEPQNILLIGNDEHFAHGVADMLRDHCGATKVATTPTLATGLAELAAQSYHAVLYELPIASAAGLFQVTQLAIKIPRLPVVVFGPANDGRLGGNHPVGRAGLSDQG